jgi:hypothetical protein
MLTRREFSRLSFAIAALFAIVSTSSAAFVSTLDVTASLNGVGSINATAAHGVFLGNNVGATEPTLLTLLNTGTSTVPSPGTVVIEDDAHNQYDIKISSTGMFSTNSGVGVLPPVNGSTVDLLSGTAIVLGATEDWSLVGTTDVGGGAGGPFNSIANGATTINLDSAITGRFVIGLKAGNFYAVYAFDIATSVNQLVFNMPITNPPGNSDLGLSHASLYTAPSPDGPDTRSIVPEPASMAIFGLGALGMGFIARRRRQTSSIAA